MPFYPDNFYSENSSSQNEYEQPSHMDNNFQYDFVDQNFIKDFDAMGQIEEHSKTEITESSNVRSTFIPSKGIRWTDDVRMCDDENINTSTSSQNVQGLRDSSKSTPWKPIALMWHCFKKLGCPTTSKRMSMDFK